MVNIPFLILVEVTKGNHLVKQLLYHKRCFGGHADMGIVNSSGKVDICDSVAKLVSKGHVPTGLEWIDPFLRAMPSLREISADGFYVTPFKYGDGPPSPWDIATREQEMARTRARNRRDKAKLNLRLACLGGNSGHY